MQPAFYIFKSVTNLLAQAVIILLQKFLVIYRFILSGFKIVICVIWRYLRKKDKNLILIL
jgi:hypothetical protein